jgi:hypothetical protein
VTPTTAARRQRRRIAHWHSQAVLALLRLGAGPDELRLVGVLAQRLKSRAVTGLEDRGATTPPAAPR